mmetsp:Transcript_7015/g.12584  ORF Transcript_7015/g.12584 Transcript_7015/m.12584 type:complete len:231 (-) Transcript_7015:58-750(-)
MIFACQDVVLAFNGRWFGLGVNLQHVVIKGIEDRSSASGGIQVQLGLNLAQQIGVVLGSALNLLVFLRQIRQYPLALCLTPPFSLSRRHHGLRNCRHTPPQLHHPTHHSSDGNGGGAQNANDRAACDSNDASHDAAVLQADGESERGDHDGDTHRTDGTPYNVTDAAHGTLAQILGPRLRKHRIQLFGSFLLILLGLVGLSLLSLRIRLLLITARHDSKICLLVPVEDIE